MGPVEILIWLMLLAFVVKGFMKGLVREVCSLLGLVAGCWAAFRYYAYLAEAIRPFIHLPAKVAGTVSFVLVFLVVGLLFYLCGHFLTVVFKIMLLGGVNKIGGVVFGLAEGALLLCLILSLCTTKPVPEKVKGYILRSRTAQPFVESGRQIIAGWDSSSRVVKAIQKSN